jgi:hypothetical protein
VYHYPDGRSGFYPVVSENDWHRQGGCWSRRQWHCWQPLGQPHACPLQANSHPPAKTSRRNIACYAAQHGSTTLRHEVNIIHILQAEGCGYHLPQVLGIVQHGRPHQMPDLLQEASRQHATAACCTCPCCGAVRALWSQGVARASTLICCACWPPAVAPAWLRHAII